MGTNDKSDSENKGAGSSGDKKGSNAGGRNVIIGIIAVIAVLIIAAAILGSNPAKPAQQGTTSQQASFNVTSYGTTVPNPNASTTANSSMKLADSQYAQIAHLVYAPNQTSIKYEAAGFNINITQLASGAVNVTFSKLGNAGLNSTFTVPKGDSLYYLDGSIGDDSPPTGEYSLSDDGFVLVNATGYIVGNVATP